MLQNLRGPAFPVTRRYFQGPEGWIRVVDIIRNPKPDEQTVTVTLSSNVNFGIQSSRPIPDPRNPESTLGLIITDSQARVGLRVFGGGGTSRVTPVVNNVQQNNRLQTVYELRIPGEKEVAIAHFCAIVTSEDEARKMFAVASDARSLSNIPAKVRQLIVNFPTATGGIAELELLRGGATDVVELRNGDQLRGELLMDKWAIQTAYGPVEVPLDKLAGYLVTPGIKPRQLLVTADGEVIGGRLAATTVPLQFTNGQKIEFPVEEISRIGRRSSAMPPEKENKEFRPMVFLPHRRPNGGTASRAAVGRRHAIRTIAPEAIPGRLD